MARWGKADFKELKRLEQKLARLERVDFDKLCREMAADLAKRLLRMVKYRTPVDTGALRDNWSVTPVVHKGDHYTVTVLNNYIYASYVEYGHRQVVRVRAGEDEAGNKQYELKYTGWTKGRFMLTISAQTLESRVPVILEKKLYQALKGVFE